MLRNANKLIEAGWNKHIDVVLLTGHSKLSRLSFSEHLSHKDMFF